MNKNIILAALFAATTASAGINLTGEYKGTFIEGATYTQDLDLTLVGSTEGGTSVTMKMEDLTGGSNVNATQVFINTTVEGFKLKGGTYKSKNGKGLLQVESDSDNQFEVSTDISGIDITVKQVSGDSNATVNISSNIAGVAITVQDVASDYRYVTAEAAIAGLGVNVETQNTGTGTNTGISVSAAGTLLDITGVFIDVNDATGITQDNRHNDGILGDISDANTDVTGIVVSSGTELGTITGKYIDKNNTTTYIGELKRGIITYRYSKTDNIDGEFSARVAFSF